MTGRRALALAVVIANALSGAAQTPPAFDVAAIKPVPRPFPTGGGAWTVTHGRFRAETCYVRGLIAWAYGVPGSQVRGGPDWLDPEPYYIDARAADPEAGPDQIREMSKTLLAERFKLVVHRETQQGQVYTMTVAKGGSKLQDAKDGHRNWINWTGPGRVTFEENQGLAGLVNIASALLGAPVIDETGLKSSYNFNLEFTDPRDPRPRQPDAPPDLIPAMQEQLGLRLQATKAPVEVLIIDHMERPTEN